MIPQSSRTTKGRTHRLGVESLEGRCLMASGSYPFFSKSGVLSSRKQRDAVAIPVDESEFDLPRGSALISINVRAKAFVGLDPGPVPLTSDGAVGMLRMRRDVAHGRGSLTLADVGPGVCVALVQAERRTNGAYRLEVGLVGDVDGDGDVDDRDLDRIRGRQGRTIGRPGYLRGADVDRDGRIDRADFALASRNRGVVRHPSRGLTARLDDDSDPNGDSRVLRRDVGVVGRAAPGAKVVLDVGADGTADRSTTADALGYYRFDVGLSYGATPLRVASDGAEAVELVAQRSDVVLDWNKQLLDAIRIDRTTPPLAARNMAIVQIAAFDAVNAIDGSHAPYALRQSEAPWVSAEAAAASAAHRALVALYPARADAFDAALAATLADVPDGAAESRGIELGRVAAEAILASRQSDGSGATYAYPGSSAPGQWRPTPPAFAPGVLPQWPFVTPFALARADQFRPPAPPALTSAEYAADVEEVRLLGRAEGAVRTPEQTLIARFWADGAGTATPPGHWNQVAADVARQRGSSLAENAHLFALLNIAMADAGIASWEAKYSYGLWRPITAIREADLDGNPTTEADPSWIPLLATPPFPSYTSGHSTFSGAAAEVLSFIFGDDTSFTTDTDDLPGVVRPFTSFVQAAEEAGRSRVYGGIHFEFDNRAGLTAGRAVGRYVSSTMLV